MLPVVAAGAELGAQRRVRPPPRIDVAAAAEAAGGRRRAARVTQLRAVVQRCKRADVVGLADLVCIRLRLGAEDARRRRHGVVLLPSGGGELALLRGGDARLATCLALAHRVVNVAALLERSDERLLVGVLLVLLALLLLPHLLRAAHALVPRDRIDSSTGLILRTESSVLFCIPWGSHWLIGTTDTDWSHDLAHPSATRADVDYLLAEINEVLARPLVPEDVEGVFAGLRPLLAEGDDAPRIILGDVTRDDIDAARREVDYLGRRRPTTYAAWERDG